MKIKCFLCRKEFPKEDVAKHKERDTYICRECCIKYCGYTQNVEIPEYIKWRYYFFLKSIIEPDDLEKLRSWMELKES